MHHALICSSVNGHVDIVSWLTKTMSLPAMESNSWLMATHCAKGDVEQTKHLAAQIGYNVTPAMSQSLRAAAFRGNQELVTWFLQNTSADVNNRGIIEPAFGDVTALGAACSWGHVEIAHLLLQERECLIDASTSSKGDSPMHLGVWCNNFGWTLLHWAAARGEHEVLYLWLAAIFIFIFIIIITTIIKSLFFPFKRRCMVHSANEAKPAKT